MDAGPDAELYITFARVKVAVGMAPIRTKWIFDSALIYIESNVLPSIGLTLFIAAKIRNMRSEIPKLGNNLKA